MAFALDGTVGETVIEARDIRHAIRFGINGVTREPQIEHTEDPGFVHSGTSITVRWPAFGRRAYQGPMRPTKAGFMILCANCQKEFESKGLGVAPPNVSAVTARRRITSR